MSIKLYFHTLIQLTPQSILLYSVAIYYLEIHSRQSPHTFVSSVLTK